MTDAEIKKSLECCIFGDCLGCIYGETDQRHCKDDLMQNALNLINRQQAKFAKCADAFLKKEDITQAIANERQQYYDELQTAKVEIEMLNGLVADGDKAFNKMTELYNKAFNRCRKAEAEAIREFLKRLRHKADYYENGEGWEGNIYYEDDIEETYKEMVGE